MTGERAGEIGGSGSTPISGVGIKLMAFPLPDGAITTMLLSTRPGIVEV